MSDSALITKEDRALARREIFALELAMKRCNADGTLMPFDPPVHHFFAEGVYVRQMFIPAGVALVGHIHKHSCVNFVLGEIEVATEEGKKRIVGPITFASPAGVKRAGYAVRDTLWTTIHANPDNERDPDKLLEMLIIDVYDKVTGEPLPELVEKL